MFLMEPHQLLVIVTYAIYEKIAQQAPSVLTPDGKIYLEIGYKGAKVKRAFSRGISPTNAFEFWKDHLDKIEWQQQTMDHIEKELEAGRAVILPTETSLHFQSLDQEEAIIFTN